LVFFEAVEDLSVEPTEAGKICPASKPLFSEGNVPADGLKVAKPAPPVENSGAGGKHAPTPHYYAGPVEGGGQC
jgi:hypothetical protein